MRLHLIDGTYELYRAHFSKRPDVRDPSGRDIKGTMGVVWSMLALFDDPDERATHVAAAFDNPIRSFRNDLFDGYKSDEGVPPEISAQFDLVEAALRAIGVVVWSMDRWEADDALATAAARWSNDVDQVRICTPDKDLGQSIRGEQVVQVDRMRKKVVGEKELMAARGIRPASIPDYLALVGDTADGIPGIKGFGEKTAAALLHEYVHIEAIPERAADWKVNVRGAPALAPLLASSRDEVLLYRKLATLVTDVPLKESLDDLAWRGAPREPFEAWCRDVGASNQLRQKVKLR
jgi:5'-3' exonuclease